MGKINVRQMIVGPIGTNCYLVNRTGSQLAIIIDPGAAAHRIQAELTKQGWKATAILLTHGHFDHIGAIPDLEEKETLPYYLHEEDQELIQSPEANVSLMFGHPYSVKPDRLIKDGDKLEIDGIEFQVIHTPGHTQGSCCFYIQEAGLLFSGDTLFCASHGRTDFPTGSESAIIHSIKDKLFLLPDETRVLPGHNSETTIKAEKKWF